MTGPDAPKLDPAILAANLTVLRRTHPTLTDLIAAEPPPLPALTRDGRLSFRVTGADGHAAWLGRTSIPAVRAEALLERFDTGAGNVLLPGFAQGCEVDLLLARLPRHRAVFVWEPDPASLALVLRLYDWSSDLALARLVPFVCPLEALTGKLVDWLTEHAGHLCPERIMSWPWSTPPELAAIRSAVQNAYAELDRRRSILLADLRATLAADRPPTAARTLAILAPRPTELAHLLTDGLATATPHTGWQPLAITVAGPADVHPLVRARKLAAAGHRPDLAILADHTRREARDLLAEETPAICWLGPGVAPRSAEAAGDQDLLAVTHIRHREQALCVGVAPQRCIIVPYPCLLPPATEALPQAARDGGVLMFADLKATDPAALGFQLASHQQLWNVLLQMLRAEIDGFTDGQAASLLSRAEAKTRIRLDDPGIRQAMLAGLCNPAAAGLLRQEIAQRLCEHKVTVDIRGAGWPDQPPLDPPRPCQTLAERGRLLARARLFIHADPTGEVPPEVLLAAAAGAVVVARAHPTDDQPGGLGTLLAVSSEVVTFRGLGELVSIIRRLLANPQHCQALADRARARVLADHLPAHRLEALIAAASSAFPAVRSLT